MAEASSLVYSCTYVGSFLISSPVSRISLPYPLRPPFLTFSTTNWHTCLRKTGPHLHALIRSRFAKPSRRRRRETLVVSFSPHLCAHMILTNVLTSQPCPPPLAHAGASSTLNSHFRRPRLLSKHKSTNSLKAAFSRSRVNFATRSMTWSTKTTYSQSMSPRCSTAMASMPLSNSQW